MSPVDKFIKMGWEILENKYRYYILNEPSLTDFEFDKLEADYRALAKELNLPPTASDMVDFNWDRPSCQHAAFRVHGIDPSSGDYSLGRNGTVYQRTNKGLKKITRKNTRNVK